MNSSLVQNDSIASIFHALRASGKIGLMPFIPAGYPDLETTAAVIPEMQAAGASVIEVGFPFSDPIADGPTIQAAFSETLARKIKVSDILRTISSIRPRPTIPLIAMISYSIVYRYGLDRFLKDIVDAGFSGLLVPDLPPPEAQRVCETVRTAGLDTVLLVAPTTSPERRAEIAKLCSGFVYYLSVSGITGERDRLPADLETNVLALKKLTDQPVCVGFGVNKPEHVKQLRGVADGAIVGSAIVKRMQQHAGADAIAIAKGVGDYCRELLSLVK